MARPTERDAVGDPTPVDPPTQPSVVAASAAPSGSAAADLADLDWRRPHPLTILVELGRAIRSIIVAVVVVSGGVLDQAAFLEGALLIAPFGAAIGRWYTTRYAIDDESVHLHRGLLWRSKQVLPRANIQNVSTKAGLLARMGSVVDLQISDASATGDIQIQFVSQDEANRLTTLLRSSTMANPGPAPVPGVPGFGPDGDRVPTTELDAPAPGGPAVEREPLVATPLRPLLLAELTASSTVLFAVLGAVLVSTFALVVWLEPYGIELAILPSSTSPWMVGALGVAAALLIAGVGVAQRLLALGGFHLWADPDRLRIRVGLLTEARVAARRERIQQIRVERDALHRSLGIERVAYETADLEVEGTAGTGYLAPVAAADRWRELAAEVVGDVQLDENDLQAVSPLTARRVFLRFVLVSLPMLGLVFLHPALPLVIVPWLAAGWFYSRARFRILGYAGSGDQFLVRNGVFFGRLTLVRLDKVQSVRVRATIFQRRLGLATLVLVTAGNVVGGLVSLPDLPAATADELMTTLARRAASTPIDDTL